jgi:hypothetical protein
VAVNVCGGLEGVIQVGSQGFSIRPAGGAAGLEGEHLLALLPPRGQADTEEVDRNNMERRKRESPEDPANSTADPLTGDEDMFTWYEVGPATPTLHQVDLDSAMAAADPLADLEETGHPADRVWQVKPPTA